MKIFVPGIIAAVAACIATFGGASAGPVPCENVATYRRIKNYKCKGAADLRRDYAVSSPMECQRDCTASEACEGYQMVTRKKDSADGKCSLYGKMPKRAGGTKNLKANCNQKTAFKNCGPPGPPATCDAFLNCSDPTLNRGIDVACDSSDAATCTEELCCNAPATCQGENIKCADPTLNRWRNKNKTLGTPEIREYCPGDATTCTEEICCDAPANCGKRNIKCAHDSLNRWRRNKTLGIPEIREYCPGDATTCTEEICCDRPAWCGDRKGIRDLSDAPFPFPEEIDSLIEIDYLIAMASPTDLIDGPCFETFYDGDDRRRREVPCFNGPCQHPTLERGNGILSDEVCIGDVDTCDEATCCNAPATCSSYFTDLYGREFPRLDINPREPGPNTQDTSQDFSTVCKDRTFLGLRIKATDIDNIEIPATLRETGKIAATSLLNLLEPATQPVGTGALTYLDGHHVECPEGMALASWKLNTCEDRTGIIYRRFQRRNSLSDQVRIDYTCNSFLEALPDSGKSTTVTKTTDCATAVDDLAFNRHKVTCPSGMVMISWRLERCANLGRTEEVQAKIEYKCTAAKFVPPSGLKEKQSSDGLKERQSSGCDLASLNNHNVECAPGKVLTRWQMTDDVCDVPDQRIRFQCVEAFWSPCAHPSLEIRSDGRYDAPFPFPEEIGSRDFAMAFPTALNFNNDFNGFNRAYGQCPGDLSTCNPITCCRPQARCPAYPRGYDDSVDFINVELQKQQDVSFKVPQGNNFFLGERFRQVCSHPTLTRGTEVACDGDEYTCDEDTCCKEQATCGNGGVWGNCKHPSLNNEERTCPGDATTCNEELCCEIPATCFSFQCDKSILNFGWKNCTGDEDTCTKTHCCKEQATCDEYSGNGQCDHPSLGKGATTECKGAYETCDKTTCCNPPATCDSFTECDDATLKKGKDVQCAGNEGTCNTQTCCNKPATCSAFTDCDHPTLNKGGKITCSGNADTCTEELCCRDPATCNAFQNRGDGCDHPTLSKGKDVPCAGDVETCNEALCCDGPALCGASKDLTASDCADPTLWAPTAPCIGDDTTCKTDWCCNPPATCESFEGKCDHPSLNMGRKESGVVGSNKNCTGAESTCDPATCCNAPATCSAFDRCADPSLNKGSNVTCVGNVNTCTTELCCNAPAPCAGFAGCPDSGESQFRNCSGAESTCDKATCCPTPPPCENVATYDRIKNYKCKGAADLRRDYAVSTPMECQRDCTASDACQGYQMVTRKKDSADGKCSLFGKLPTKGGKKNLKANCNRVAFRKCDPIAPEPEFLPMTQPTPAPTPEEAEPEIVPMSLPTPAPTPEPTPEPTTCNGKHSFKKYSNKACNSDDRMYGLGFSAKGNTYTQCKAYCNDNQDCKGFQFNAKKGQCKLYSDFLPTPVKSNNNLNCNLKGKCITDPTPD